MHPETLTYIANTYGGLPILGCASGSPAGLAGLRYGDIVLAVNGVATPSWEAFFEACGVAHGEVRVRVFRLGREFEVGMVLGPGVRTPRGFLEAAVVQGGVGVTA